MEISLEVDLYLINYYLFSEDRYAYWLIRWFNEKGLLNNEKDLIEIPVQYSIVHELIHDCIDIMLNPYEYIDTHKFILNENSSQYLRDSVAKDMRTSAKNIINNVCANCIDDLYEANYVLLFEQ